MPRLQSTCCVVSTFTIPFSKQIFDEAALKMRTMYNTPVPNRFKLQYLCGSHMVQKVRNQLQAPRRTASPWRGETLENFCPEENASPDLHTIDEIERAAAVHQRHGSNCQERKGDTRHAARPKETDIVSQSTIIWQDIHPKGDCPNVRKQRKTALKATLKSRKDRQHRVEQEFITRIKRTPTTRLNDCTRVEDIAKQSDRFETPEHFMDLSWTPRHKDIKLASISPKAVRKRLGRGANIKANQSSSENTLLITCKTILPSLQKLV